MVAASERVGGIEGTGLGGCSVGGGVSGVREADGVGDGLVAGRGAMGTDGEVGASFLARCRGRAMRATAAQVAAAPTAARTRRRRAAVRRIVS